MEVKPGYKQTDIGVIPEDWEVTPMFRITEQNRPITYGIVQAGPHLENGIPYIRSSDLNASCIEISTLLRTSNQIAEFYKRSEVYPRDIVFSLRGNIGISKIVPNELKRANLTQGTARISCKKNILNIYVIYSLYSSYFRKQIENAQKGSTFQEVSLGMLRSFHILLPPLPEQHTIATALSDADARISSLDKVIAKKCDIKQAAMQELLTGKRRLPGFNKKWDILKMSEKSTLKARIGWQGLTTAEYLESGDYYLITGTDFQEGRIYWSSCCFVDESRYVQDKNIQLKTGDILLTKDGTIGKVGYIDSLPGPATLNSGVFVIRPINDAYDPLYFYYVLMSRIFEDFLTKLQAGSTIIHLYQKDFINFSFLAPDIAEQQAIASVLSDMDAELAALEQQRDKTKAIKKGMMQELLTGRIRLT